MEGKWERERPSLIISHLTEHHCPSNKSLESYEAIFLVQAKPFPAFSVFQAFLVQHLFPPLEESWLDLESQFGFIYACNESWAQIC